MFRRRGQDSNLQGIAPGGFQDRCLTNSAHPSFTKCILPKKIIVSYHKDNMRFLGIDYGKKRVGLALSDEEGMMAFPYKTLMNKKEMIEEILKICKEEEVDFIVLGRSQTLSGKDNPIMKDIKRFKEKIEKNMDISIHMEPEFFTTTEAFKIQGRNKNVDASAASIILQRFLERYNFGDTEVKNYTV